MEICPVCKSDHLEKGYSIGLRVVVCLILVFLVPYGLFLAWIPFVFPYKYLCQLCGSEVDVDKVIKMDWREREELLKEHQALEEKIAPFIGKWVENQEGRTFKIAKGKGQIMLVEVHQNMELKTYRVVDCNGQNDEPKIIASSKVASKFRDVAHITGSYANGDVNGPELTPLGQELLSDEEFNHIKDDDWNWFNELTKTQQKVIVEIRAE